MLMTISIEYEKRGRRGVHQTQTALDPSPPQLTVWAASLRTDWDMSTQIT